MSEDNLMCPRCGLSLPAGTKRCPECGKELVRPPKPPEADIRGANRRRSIQTAIGCSAALVFAIFTFEAGYTAIFIAFVVPAVAFALVYTWERNRGIKPGWEFFALSAVGTYAGGIFGWTYVLVPVVIYFLAFRYWLNRKARRLGALAGTISG